MKTTALTLLIPLTLASSTLAQTGATTTTTARQVQTRTTTAERIVMASGALVEIKGDQATRVNLDTLLPNGARVTPGGTVTYADGTSATLRDGQMITMDGKITAAPAQFVAKANATLDAGTSGAAGRATSGAAGGTTTTTIETGTAGTGGGSDTTSGTSMGGSGSTTGQ